MRSTPSICLPVVLALVLAAGAAEARGPCRDVLGIAPGMTEEEAHERLERFGTKQGGEEAEEREEAEKGGRELWTLEHPRFTYVMLVVDAEKRVQYVQGYLHKDRKPLRYGDIGSLKQARQTGYYIYVWDVPARGDQPALQITARGTDPRIPGSYSVAARPLGAGARQRSGDSEDRAMRSSSR